MTLDLTRPEHREALRWACWLHGEHSEHAHNETRVALAATRPNINQVALRALASPSASAAIVRALLEGCGVDATVIADERWFASTNDVALWTYGDRMVIDAIGDDMPIGEALDVQQRAALILALLACTDRDGALAALKEAER